MTMLLRGVCLVFTLVLGLKTHTCQCDEAALEALMERMQDDVSEFAAEVENAYLERCSDDTLSKCYESNYDDCLSDYPNPSCPGGDQWTAPECGDGAQCGSLLDFSVSAVRLPNEIADGYARNPTNDEVLETVCFTRTLDEYMKEKYNDDTRFGLNPPQMYFGALDGTFRIFPARHSKTCGQYDARLRPWYQAGSSGPKDVVLILDQSGSMSSRMDLMKKAASRIINTLTIGDRVAVVGFSDSATSIVPISHLIPATKENKQSLVEAVQGLKAAGKTNFWDAFTKAFIMYGNTIEQELHSGCNAAFIFFTDGEMTTPEGVSEDDIIRLVKSRKADVEATTKRPLTLFTYSLGGESVHTIPRRLGCETEGLWTKIEDERYLVQSMSSYYKLFALGLGEESDTNFAAWVEPYAFASGSRDMGTTVSAPVYDRTVTPPLFLGVVGMDFPLSEMDKALGVQAGSRETLDYVVRASTAKCPSLNLTLCQLESLRRQTGGIGATCASNCTEDDFVPIEPEKCTAVSDYPSNLWANTDNAGKTFEEKVCCGVGEDGDCPSADDSPPWTGATSSISRTTMLLFILAAAGVMLVLIIFVCLLCKKCKVSNEKGAKGNPTAAVGPSTTVVASPVGVLGFSYEATSQPIQVLPPPSAPPANT